MGDRLGIRGAVFILWLLPRLEYRSSFLVYLYSLIFTASQSTFKKFVRSGIRTHAHRSGLRPERSALDHSAILTNADKIFHISHTQTTECLKYI